MTADHVIQGERRSASPTGDAAAALVEQLIDAVQAGADAESLIAAHPEHADTLRRLLPAARLSPTCPRPASGAASARRLTSTTSTSRSATSA